MSGELLKSPEEAGIVVEAAGEGNLREGLSGADQLLGAEDAAVDHIVIDASSSVGGKFPGHVGGTDAKLAG